MSDAIELAQAEESLRQQRAVFEQQKAQDKKTFVLRLTMGWTAVLLLVAICAFAGYIIVNHHNYAAATVTAATSALLVEALGVAAAIWRGTLGKGPKELKPTTPPPSTFTRVE